MNEFVRAARKVNHRQRFSDFLFSQRRAESGHFQAKLHILRRRKPWEQAVILKHHGSRRPGRADRLAVEKRGAAVRSSHAGGDVEQRRFPASRRADDDDEFAGLTGE